jgi:hypothetical protein
MKAVVFYLNADSESITWKKSILLAENAKSPIIKASFNWRS